MENKETKLSDLLKEKFVELDLKEDTKPKIIAELVDLIGKSSRVKNKKALSKAMLEREKLGSTAIGNGVAIPHVKTDGVKNFILAFARKTAGVNFESLDGEKPYIFFILASPKDMVGQDKEYIGLLTVQSLKINPRGLTGKGQDKIL